MEFTSITIGMPVKDVEEASQWYERCFDLKAPINPAPDIREYQIYPGCWLQLSQAPTADSEHSLLFGVADLEGARKRLTQLGIDVGDIQRVEGIIAWCDFMDPDGNRLSLYLVEQT